MHPLKLVIGAIAIAAAGIGGMRLTGNMIEAAAPAQEGSDLRGGAGRTIRVETMAPVMMTFAREVTAVGTTRPRQAVEIRPEVNGRVTEIAFSPGQSVAAGDVLLRLDDAADRAALKAAEATVRETAAAADRQAALLREGRLAEATFEAAEAAALRAEAERDLAQVALDLRTLRAPFAGVVGLTDISPGSLVDRDMLITTLDDLTTVEVDFRVPERYMSWLAPGLPVTLAGPAYPDDRFAGRITAIDTRVESASRSIAVRATVGNADRRLAAGMFMQVTLSFDIRTRPAVPETALEVDGEDSFLHVARGGVARRVAITPGQARDGFIEITAGLRPDDHVIVAGLIGIHDGSAVEAVLREASAGPGETP